MNARRRTPRSLLRRFVVSQRGAIMTLENVLWAPVFLLGMATVFQGVAYGHAYNTAQAIAQSAYEEQRLWGASTNAGTTYANQQLANAANILVDGQATITNTGDVVTVAVTAQAPSFLPGIDLPISVDYTGPAEIWTGS